MDARIKINDVYYIRETKFKVNDVITSEYRIQLKNNPRTVLEIDYNNEGSYILDDGSYIKFSQEKAFFSTEEYPEKLI